MLDMAPFTAFRVTGFASRLLPLHPGLGFDEEKGGDH
jgi:hypothetical protein